MDSSGQTDWQTNLENLYHQLLRISREQQTLMMNLSGDDGFGDRFAELAGEWDVTQNDIVRMEETLKQAIGHQPVKAFFDETLADIVQTIQATIRETAANMSKEISNTGTSLRNVREHQQAKQAYADSDIGSFAAIYMDEKK